jgi:serine/threonine-protein kinase
MECCSDTELLEYADGLLPERRRREVALHLDACADCRAVLVAIARVSEAAPLREPADLPQALLEAALRREAPRRERIATVVMLALAVVTLPTLAFIAEEGARFAIAATAIQIVVIVYELAVHLALRRGWFHRSLPLVNALFETTSFMAMMFAAALTLPAELALRPPALMVIGGMIVFTAIRAEPRISISVGLLAAVQYLVLFELVREGVIVAHAVEGGPFDGPGRPPSEIPSAAGPVMAVFFAFCGVAGAAVSRHLVGQAESALRAVREQDLFGKYLLHEPLGRGGMGEVVRATYCPEGGFTKTVAVKRLPDDLARESWFVDSLRREARLCSTMAHPNLVQVLDCGRFRGAFVLVMEYVDGLSLSALLARSESPLPFAAVTALAAELAAALAYVHERRAPDGASLGLVHCDLNPPNVLLSRLGEVKLADFGVARALVARDHTSAIAFGGKRSYAAPEQIAGRALDGRADLYALGLTIHEALTGVRVSGGEAPRRTIPPPSQLRADVPRELDALVLDLIADSADDRPQSAAIVRTRLLAMNGALAPYPSGIEALARAVDHARPSIASADAAPTRVDA